MSECLKLVAYTDGSCDNKSKLRIGGAAYIVMNREGKREVLYQNSKGFAYTSSNRMEMLAIISAVAACPPGSDIEVFSDSRYAVCTLSGIYMLRENEDLVEKYKQVAKKHSDVRLRWIKGHSGHPLNEHVDAMAYEAYRAMCERMGDVAKAHK